MYDQDFNQPLWNLFYYSNKANELEKEVGDFLRKNVPNPKFYSNDIRHQYASAIFSRNFGNDKAEILGNLHEWINPGGQQDTKIDKINNKIGREYGERYKEIPRGELLFKLLSDHDINRKRRQEEINK